MFFGALAHWADQRRFFPAAFDTALAFALRPDCATLPAGTYEIDGKNIYAMVQEPETEPEHRRRIELHRKYIDIQLLLAGTEKQLYAPDPLAPASGATASSAAASTATLLEDKLAASDVAFYTTPTHHNAVILTPGEFTIYFPDELHAPNCAPATPGPIRKIVFKLLADAV